MLDPDITITRTTEESRYAPGTFDPVQYFRVEFMVGKFGPFIEKIDKDGYTRDVRDLRLNDRAAHVRA